MFLCSVTFPILWQANKNHNIFHCVVAEVYPLLLPWLTNDFLKCLVTTKERKLWDRSCLYLPVTGCFHFSGLPRGLPLRNYQTDPSAESRFLEQKAFVVILVLAGYTGNIGPSLMAAFYVLLKCTNIIYIFYISVLVDTKKCSVRF